MELLNNEGKVIGHLFTTITGCTPLKTRGKIIGYVNIPEEEELSATEEDEEVLNVNKRKRKDENEGPMKKRKQSFCNDFNYFLSNDREIINNQWLRLHPDKASTHLRKKASYFWKRMTTTEKENNSFPHRLQKE